MAFNHQKFVAIAVCLTASAVVGSSPVFATGLTPLFEPTAATSLFSAEELHEVARPSKGRSRIVSDKESARIANRLPQKVKTGTVAALLAQPVQSFASMAAAAGVTSLKTEKAIRPVVVSAPVPTMNPVVPIAAPTEDSPESTIVVNVEKKSRTGQREQQTALLKIDSIPVKEQKSAVHLQEISVERRAGALTVNPPNISLAARGSKAKVSFKSDRSNEADFIKGLSIFVRDAQNLEWNAAKRELVAKSPGRTELYIVTNEKMHIVPVNITGSSGANWDLQVPDTLVSLDGLVQKQNTAAIFPDQISSSGISTSTPASSVSGQGTEAPALTIHDSLADVSQTANRTRTAQGRYSRQAETLSYSKVTVQIVDERTRSGEGVYPVAGARLKVVGTEFTGESDSTGHIIINDVPQRARLQVVVDHPAGLYRSGVSEVRTIRSVDSGVQRMKVSREFAFDANTRLAGVVQNAGLGSLCGITIDAYASGRPVTGVRIALDVRAEGPYYFNRFGFLDRSLTATTETGRFCFFNTDAGPALGSFYVDGGLVATLPLTLFAGRHLEEDYALAQTVNYGVQLATASTAHEQLSSDTVRAASYQSVDVVDLLPIGSDRAFTLVENGYVTSADPLVPYRGRNLVLVRASEFESAVYSLDSTRSTEHQITPFLPRGFIEDMSVYAQVAHDPSLGSVLVEHGSLSGQGTETIHVRLLNENSFDVGEAWYYSDTPVTRAIFFNVPPGTYSVLVETANRFWLAADTVTVFSETVSYVPSGATLRVKN